MKITSLLLTLLTAFTTYADPVISGTITSSGTIQSLNVSRQFKYGTALVVNVNTPAPMTFTCVAATDICTAAAHGMGLGLVVQVSTTSTLPGGLATTTNYYIIPLSANTFMFATTLANALSGTQIDITSAGTGVQTINPTALSGASVVLQGSMDNSTWFNLPTKWASDTTKSANITASGTIFLSETDLVVNYVKPYFNMTSGQINVQQLYKTHDATK